MVKHYKARIENLRNNWHSMIIYLDAENIGDALEDIKIYLAPLGIDNTNVTQLIEETSHGH